METIATILYARLRNIIPVCNAMPPECGAQFAGDPRKRASRTPLQATIRNQSSHRGQGRPR